MTTLTETKPMSPGNTITGSATSGNEPLILVEPDGHVGIVKINRPKVLNALNPELMTMLATQLEAFDKDATIHVILLAGTERAWAAGADIGDMAEQSAISM